MRRLFWGVVGIGLGAVVGAQVVRWTNKTKAKYSPPNLARQAGGKLDEWKSRAREAVEEGLTEMVAREAEIRAEIGLPLK